MAGCVLQLLNSVLQPWLILITPLTQLVWDQSTDRSTVRYFMFKRRSLQGT